MSNGEFQNVNGFDVKIYLFLLNFTEFTQMLIKMASFLDELSNDMNFGPSQEAERENIPTKTTLKRTSEILGSHTRRRLPKRKTH